MFFSAAVPAIPDAARVHADSWRESGRGEMRWFGLKLYDAELWVSGPAYQSDKPFALQLTYSRDFAGQRLAARSIDEMQRLGRFDETQASRWQKQLERAFPDVKSGEQITGVYLPGRGAVFYHQGRLTAELNDAELARRFFSIWLDPATREPVLRERLLGVRQ
ncbi:MAG: chalcone isomerase family protein [Rhodocyclaceae bacterium]